MESGPKMAWGSRKKERVHQNGADKLTSMHILSFASTTEA